ncbi:MAG: hypothetical protein KKF54_01225 [Candidatus Omnitrophica bacterium]|nr:hypothetical protein [Candidatus Omnitrophota bacterium]
MKAVPTQLKDLVRSHRVILSEKARHQLDLGKFDTNDLINSILRGKIIKKEKDEQRESQYKYTVVGPSHSGTHIYSCGKVVKLIKKNYFVITFHETR